jgi:outer membrane protein
MKSIGLVLVLPAVLAAQVPGDTSVHPIRLSEAVRLAQQNAPAAVEARGSIRSSAAQVRAAYAAFLPSVSLNAGMSQQGGQRFDSQGRLVPFTGQPWQLNHGLSLNLDLFAGGERLYNLRSAQAQADAASANEVAQRYQIALQVKQQFYAVLAAREALAAAESQLKEAEEQLAASTAKLRARTATRSDSLRSAIQVGNARLALLTAQNNLQTANAALTRLVATPFTVTASPEDTVAEDLTPIDSAALAVLVAQGPAIQQAAASEAAARAAAKAARAPYLPTLSLSYSVTGNGSDSSFVLLADRYAYQHQLRFSLSYPLFNQLQRERSIVQADVAARNAEAARRDAALLAQQNFVQYLGALRTAQEQVQIQTASVAAAEEDLRVQKQRYDLGASTLLDVLTSEAALVQARATLIQARYNYRVAKAQLEALIGREL